jgi:uncharacterized Zn finger protein (UPF0148 family)
MHVMRAVEGPENVVWHAMEREDTAMCGATVLPFADEDGTRLGETFCPACMAEVEVVARPVATPQSGR